MHRVGLIPVSDTMSSPITWQSSVNMSKTTHNLLHLQTCFLSCGLFWNRIPLVAKVSLKVLIFLPQVSEGWTYQFPSTAGLRREISIKQHFMDMLWGGFSIPIIWQAPWVTQRIWAIGSRVARSRPSWAAQPIQGQLKLQIETVSKNKRRKQSLESGPEIS